jgi:transcriptional regulator with XRE-family HTH domain
MKHKSSDTVGARLRSERRRLDLSQEAFAALGGVSKRSQIDYEKNRVKPASLYMEGIAGNGADVLYILTGSRAPQAAPYASSGAAERSENLSSEEGRLLNFEGSPGAAEWSVDLSSEARPEYPETELELVCDRLESSLGAAVNDFTPLVFVVPGGATLRPSLGALRAAFFDASRASALARKQAQDLERIYALTVHSVDELRFAAAQWGHPADENFPAMELLGDIQQIIEGLFPLDPMVGA